MNHDFQQLSEFLDIYSTNFLGVDKNADHHPSNALIKIIEKYGEKKAMQGLKQAINDIISESLFFDARKIQEIDSFMISQRALTLSSIRKKFSKKYQKILENKKIKSEEEYYLTVGIFNDNSCQIQDDEKNLLNNLINEYESKNRR